MTRVVGWFDRFLKWDPLGAPMFASMPATD